VDAKELRPKLVRRRKVEPRRATDQQLLREELERVASFRLNQLKLLLRPLEVIANLAPLLGLLGTVIGMIDVFSAIMAQGTGNTGVLAGGISKALITTAAGLTVAIPALFFHRFFVRRVEELVIAMEQEATKLVEVMQGNREVEGAEQQVKVSHVGSTRKGA